MLLNRKIKTLQTLLSMYKKIQNSLCSQIKKLKLHDSKRKQKKKISFGIAYNFLRQNSKVPLKKISKWKSSN